MSLTRNDRTKLQFFLLKTFFFLEFVNIIQYLIKTFFYLA